MVYCGKPSKACAECRLRRTKCDTLTPSCSQCIRAGRNCTGYRTEADMMFRDQTQHYANKRGTENDTRLVVSKKRTKASNDASESSLDSQLTCQSTMQLATQIKTLTPGLPTSSAEQATCYFFRNYVLEDNSTSGSFQYLHEIYDKELIGPALTDSIECLGMVGLANFWKVAEFQVHANKKYNSALRLVSSRLRNEDEARADQTLVAVILLGLYEINTCTGPQSMKSWTKHVIGASSLMQLKGKQCLETPIGRHIFAHLRTQIITNCIQRHVSIPSFIRDWSTYALQFQSPNDAHATTLSEQVMEFGNLRATMSSFHDYRNAEKVIKAALVIDSKLVEWAFTCPLECMFYKTLTLRQRSDGVFSDHYHIYDSIWAAALWNHYRCVRILINEVVYVQLTHLRNIQPELFDLDLRNPIFSDSQLEISTTAVIQLSHDICASVPFMLGYTEGGEVTLNSAKAVSGNLLLWPLYTAACTPLVSDMMCHWVAGRLRVISDIMGIKQAAPLSHILTKRKDLLAWELEDIKKGAGPKYEDWTHGQLMELT
ncbi:uncharacterized protein EAF01_009151 [Botrytis porri]|uniref:Zn(2)-C6 fungal-type domain-containing protein n=1 Tax=Botrytis porri TaxID=87229 RepID=A0A4Z1KME6_9HELO|nr:uncharacterized protein EAF01_009151 [Botrytis porri]KAF7896748.1 hypothetical protein EAF01_009151 [Botrytis porri]TGO87257.1 hypothetical protein BPOR_0238g00090 [Botrytis porri]